MSLPAAAGGGSGEQPAGVQADRAKRVAVQLVGGGRVVGVERQGAAGWKVEVVRYDERLEPWMAETGTGRRHLVVHLNGDLEWVRIGGSL
jgi:hypothetical protein